MEKTRKQLVATVAAMLGDQYKVSISIRHFEESLKEFDSTYFIEIVKKAAEDSLVPVIALDPFVKAVNQNEISMNRAASVIINTFFEAESEADKTDFSSCLSKKYILDHVFYQIPEILRIENSPKPPLYFKVNPHYEDTLTFKMPYFDMDYLEKHVRPEFDEISEIIPISPEDYQKSIKYEDVCTSARN